MSRRVYGDRLNGSELVCEVVVVQFQPTVLAVPRGTATHFEMKPFLVAVAVFVLEVRADRDFEARVVARFEGVLIAATVPPQFSPIFLVTPIARWSGRFVLFGACEERFPRFVVFALQFLRGGRTEYAFVSATNTGNVGVPNTVAVGKILPTSIVDLVPQTGGSVQHAAK